MLQSHSFTNTLVLRAPLEQRETMLASAEGASGENLEHSTRVLRKSVFCTTALGKKSKKNGVFSECSKVTHLRIRWFRARLRNKEKAMSRAPKARAALYASFMQKCLLYHWARQEVLKKRSVFRMLQSHSFTNTLVLRARTKRNDARERRRRERRKFGAPYASFTQKCLLPFAPLRLAKSPKKTECFQSAPKSLIYEYVGFARASGTKRKRCRERRRRERRKFGALYASFMQKCLLYHWARQEVLKKRSVFRMLQSHSFTNTLVLRAPLEQRETMLASAEGASGENLERPTRVLRKSAFCTTALGKKSKKNGVFSECSKVTHLRIRWFRARLRNKEKAMSRAPKARAEKIWCILRKFYAKVLSVPLLLAKSAKKTECFQSAPKSLIYEYVGFARASRTKRNDARERRRRERRKIGAF